MSEITADCANMQAFRFAQSRVSLELTARAMQRNVGQGHSGKPGMKAAQRIPHVGIIVAPERGSLYPSYVLAKALRSRGIRVSYFGLSVLADDVEKQGFRYVSVDRAWRLPERVFDNPPLPEKMLARLREIRKRAADMRHFSVGVLDQIVSGQFAALLRDEGVDAVLVETLIQRDFWPAIALSGIPLCGIAIELYSNAFGDFPSTSSVPRSFNGAIGHVAVQLAWSAHLVAAWAQGHAEKLKSLALLGPLPARLRTVRKRAQLLELASGVQMEHFEYGKRPIADEIVLCSDVLDTRPRRFRDRTRVFAGSCIDHERREFPFEFGKLCPEKELVVVSLGTWASSYPWTLRFLQRVVAAARQIPELQFVVATGQGREASSLGSIPENVVCQNFIPQLALLKRACLMITNCGLGTFKECVYYGVPIVAAPCKWEQFGNARKVEMMEIGSRLSVRSASVNDICEAVRSARRSERFQENMARVSRRIRESDAGQLQEAVDHLCSALGLPVEK